MSEDVKKLFGAALAIILATVSIVVIVVLSASLSQSVDGVLSSSERALTSGSVIEHPDGLELSPGVLDWGELRPYDNATRTLTVTNLLNGPVTLYLSAINWNPANASDYFKLTWDYKGAPIPAAATLNVNVTLTVSAEDFEGVPPTYSFDVMITGVWE